MTHRLIAIPTTSVALAGAWMSVGAQEPAAVGIVVE